jgi:hypothetical protein
LHQLFVPEVQLVRPAEAFLNAFQGRVALLQDARVLLPGAVVTPVELGEHPVKEPAALRRRPCDDGHVLGGELDRAQVPDEVRRAPRDTVDAQALARPRTRRGRRAGDDGLELHRSGAAFDGACDARDRLGVGFSLPADELGVGRSARRAAGGEQIDGFEEVALALSVGAEEEEVAPGEADVELLVVTKGAELQPSQIQRDPAPIMARVGNAPGRRSGRRDPHAQA